MLNLDLHTHLVEKKTNPKKFWFYAQQRNLQAVAITEHIEYDARKAYSLLLEKKPKNITLIPGLELNTEIGHIIALKTNPEIYDIEILFQKNLSLSNLKKIAKKENLLLSIAHPYGFDLDSAGYRISDKKLHSLLNQNFGVEAFSGHLAIASKFIFNSAWFKKPVNFFSYLQKNRIAKTLHLSNTAKKLKQKFDSQAYGINERIEKTLALVEKTEFITAGSDAHSAERVGDIILKLNSDNTTEKILRNLRKKKNIKWFGPNIQEKDGMYRMDFKGPTKKEILQGSTYALKKYFNKKKQEFTKRLRKKSE